MPKRTAREITAAELTKRLNADPDYPTRVQAHQRELDRTRAILDAEAQPILQQVRALGVRVPNMTALWFIKSQNQKLSELLVSHLDKEYMDMNLDGLVRGILAAGPSEGVVEKLLALLKRKKGELPKSKDDIPASSR